MTRKQLIILAAIGIALSVQAQSNAFSDIPAVIEDSLGRIWISETEALKAHGAIRGDLFGDAAAKRLVENARENRARSQATRATSADCHVSIGTVPRHFEPTFSLAEMTRNADAIFDGEVIALSQGFLGNNPGTLVKLAGDYLKGTHATHTYLFVPFARIVTSEGPVCARPVGGLTLPKRGDRFIVFKMPPPLRVDDSIILIVDPARELAHQGKAAAFLPPALQTYSTKSSPLDSLRLDIDHLLREER